MAARFQRLDTSEDISGYTDQSRFYDEPQSTYSSDDFRNDYSINQPGNVYSTDDYRRMSNTTRKPVPNSTTPPLRSMLSEQPLMGSYSENLPYGTPEKPGRPEPKHRSSTLSKTVSSIWSKARHLKGIPVSHSSTPLWAAPWLHEPDVDMHGTKSRHIRYFDPKKQRRRTFFHLFLRWLIPVLFCVALIATLYGYSSKPQLSPHEKYMFNALVMGFGLCLGFAVVSGITEYANIFRWRLLSSRYWSLQQFELLLGLSSQRKAWRFLWVGKTEGTMLPNSAQVIVFCYVILTLGLQIGIALLGLCYSVDDAPGKVTLSTGNVSIANMTYFTQTDNVDDLGVNPFLAQSGTINSYGIAGQRYAVDYVNTTDQTTQVGEVGLPMFTDNSTAWWYFFIDRCTETNCTSVIWTNRFVQVDTVCYETEIVEGGTINDSNVTFIDQSGQKIVWDYLGTESSLTTTYYANQNESCGPRCTEIYALNTGYYFDDGTWKPQFFQCNSTVAPVNSTDNTTYSAIYQLPDQQARLVAGAIGYSGTTYSMSRNNPYQSHTYDTSSPWSWTRLNGVAMTTTDMANSMMHFSMGAVAAIDDIGPRSYTTGLTPSGAQQLNVLWVWNIVILVVVPGVQLVLLFITVIWTDTAVGRDDSFLSTSSLLRPIVERLERSGCALSGDEICDLLDNPNLVYGVRMPQSNVSAYSGGMTMGNDDVMHIDVITEDENVKFSELGWMPGKRMPQGRYDGVRPRNEKVLIPPFVDGSNTVVRKRRQSF